MSNKNNMNVTDNTFNSFNTSGLLEPINLFDLDQSSDWNYLARYRNMLPYLYKAGKDGLEGIARNQQMKAYVLNDAKLLRQFKYDALYTVGLLDHSKMDNVWNFAWEHGHSAGYYSVFQWLIEVADLVK